MTILRRLLENFSGDEVIVMGRPPHPKFMLKGGLPPYPMVQIPSVSRLIRGQRYWRLLSVATGIFTGMRVIRQYRPRAIVAMYPDDGSLLTGYLLHRWSGLPLLPYFCDLYLEDYRTGWHGRLARWLQPRVFRSARSVMAATGGLQEYFIKRYGLSTLCLPACVNEPIPHAVATKNPATPLVIGYSGTINATRVGSLKALLQVIGGDEGYRLRYFTPHTPQEIESAGVWDRNCSAEYIPDGERLVEKLGECDLLFLPLTFEATENSIEQLSTCFATKTYEYFLSGRPVLLHCRSEFAMARFFHLWQCGLVVTTPGPEGLKRAIDHLTSNAEVCAQLTTNALRALVQFEGTLISNQLRKILTEVTI
jgi:Glycosyl transferase 4-like domain